MKNTANTSRTRTLWR